MDMTLATRLLISERRVVYGSPGDRHRLREFIYFERKKQATNQ
jgi:hypothetical protein